MNPNTPSTIARLSAAFPNEGIDKLKKGRSEFAYVKIEHAIDRMIDVWGLSYSTEIRQVMVEAGAVIVVARISYLDDAGNPQHKDGIGSAPLDKAGMDLDDLVKTAFASAIKKAAQYAGIGLYLATGKAPQAVTQTTPAPVEVPAHVGESPTALPDGVIGILPQERLLDKLNRLLRQAFGDVDAEPGKSQARAFTKATIGKESLRNVTKPEVTKLITELEKVARTKAS
jgi:hypothetical protein